MRKFRHWTVVSVALAMGVFLFVQRHVFAQPADEREGDREAIGAVLSAQQTVWNSVGVDAFLVGYWHSPELSFSGTSGLVHGWDGVLTRSKKNYPDRTAMARLDFSE